MYLSVNLLSEGSELFDLLKAVIREWQHANWEHERRRAAFAVSLYMRALESYRASLEELKQKVEEGYNVPFDQQMLARMEKEIEYWQKKLEELLAPKTSPRN